jgi:site-specific DNA-methyltransferase (adenine-specific)
MVPQAGSDGGQKIPDPVLGASFIAPSPSVCTQTYLFFYVNSRLEAESIESYIRTKFFRFLVALRKITQHATRSTYTWVPQQKWSCTWTDEELYAKYDLATEDVAFIEDMIRSAPSGEHGGGAQPELEYGGDDGE